MGEDNELYAQGTGKLTWYKNGQVIQVDEGTFEHGKHHGKFKHTFNSGNVDYSNRHHGEEIPLEVYVHDDGLSATDLSLGALTIDAPAEKIQAVLGSPHNVKTDAEGYTRLKYADVEVVLRNGKIQALVSLSPVLSTPRGIRKGSSAREVVDKYATKCIEGHSGYHRLYGYEITFADANRCYLRFAADSFNGKVEYIGERFVQ